MTPLVSQQTNTEQAETQKLKVHCWTDMGVLIQIVVFIQKLNNFFQVIIIKSGCFIVSTCVFEIQVISSALCLFVCVLPYTPFYCFQSS